MQTWCSFLRKVYKICKMKWNLKAADLMRSGYMSTILYCTHWAFSSHSTNLSTRTHTQITTAWCPIANFSLFFKVRNCFLPSLQAEYLWNHTVGCTKEGIWRCQLCAFTRAGPLIHTSHFIVIWQYISADIFGNIGSITERQCYLLNLPELPGLICASTQYQSCQ